MQINAQIIVQFLFSCIPEGCKFHSHYYDFPGALNYIPAHR